MIATAAPRPPHILARAFDLARSGEYSDVDAIRRTLIGEHYDSVLGHLSGPTIKRDLLKLCSAAATKAKLA